MASRPLTAQPVSTECLIVMSAASAVERLGRGMPQRIGFVRGGLPCAILWLTLALHQGMHFMIVHAESTPQRSRVQSAPQQVGEAQCHGYSCKQRPGNLQRKYCCWDTAGGICHGDLREAVWANQCELDSRCYSKERVSSEQQKSCLRWRHIASLLQCAAVCACLTVCR